MIINQKYKKTAEKMELPFAESYKIKMVESIRRSTRHERACFQLCNTLKILINYFHQFLLFLIHFQQH